MIIKNDKNKPPFEIKILDGKKIVHEIFNGIWTPQNASDYQTEFRNIVLPLIGARWTKLTIMDNFTLSIEDEVIDVIKDTLDWARKNNLKYCAHVIADKAKRLAHQEELQLLDSYGFTELFKSEMEAMQWFALKGF